MEKRKATPGHDRRKSGRLQRETPRGALRNLSRILAKSSQAVKVSPDSAHVIVSQIRTETEADLQDDLSPGQAPAFSLAIDDESQEDESSLLEAPRPSLPLDAFDHTVQSIEIRRRDSREDGQDRMSLGSLGRTRKSDGFEHLTEESGSETSAADNTGIQPAEDQPRIGMNTSLRSVNPRSVDSLIGGVQALTKCSDGLVQLGRIMRDKAQQVEAEDEDVDVDNLEQTFDASAASPWVFEIPELPEIQQESPLRFTATPARLSLGPDMSAEDIIQFGTPVQDLDSVEASSHTSSKANKRLRPQRKSRRNLRVSRHGIAYPGLPPATVKGIASASARSMGNEKLRLNKQSLEVIMEASDRFFEQLGGDLSAMSHHAGRKTIEGSDVIAIMRR